MTRDIPTKYYTDQTVSGKADLVSTIQLFICDHGTKVVALVA